MIKLDKNKNSKKCTELLNKQKRLDSLSKDNIYLYKINNHIIATSKAINEKDYYNIFLKNEDNILICNKIGENDVLNKLKEYIDKYDAIRIYELQTTYRISGISHVYPNINDIMINEIKIKFVDYNNNIQYRKLVGNDYDSFQMNIKEIY